MERGVSMKLQNKLVIRQGSSVGSWGSGTFSSSLQIRRRKGLQYFTEQYGANDVAGGYFGDDYRRPDRILSSAQMWEVYRRCSDVRSSVDSIVRRVATFDWLVEPKISPQDPQYEALKKEAHRIQQFLLTPNKSGQTYQEVMTSFLTDLLVFDTGTLELVYDRKGKLTELVPLRGSTIIPIINEHGMVLKYEQQITNEGDYFGTVPSQSSAPMFKPEQILFMSLYTNTSNPSGNPLLEALVNEVIALMRGTEHAMLALDADEIPQGILVLAGIAGRQAEEAKADLQRLKGQDHKVRIMTTPDPSGVGAKWLELKRSPKDISMREVIDDIRRTIFRTFGVLPVEMGLTGEMPRATAEVQIDVASSHLVTPIIELLQSKITAQIIPLLVEDPSHAELIQFRFDREARLDPPAQKALAEVHQIYVRNGIMTRNEAREALGLLPLSGGDIATVDINVGTVPLTAFDKPVGQAEVAEVVADESDQVVGEVGDDDAGDPVSPTSDVQATKKGKIETRSWAGFGSQDDKTRDLWFARQRELPSEWQDPKGINTIDLRDLGSTVSTYMEEVVKLWRASRKRMRSELVGKSKTAKRRAVTKELRRLEKEWIEKTGPLYGHASEIGSRKAIELTSERLSQEAREELLKGFEEEQYGYLRAKLLKSLKDKLLGFDLERALSGSKNIILRAQTEEEAIEEAYNSEEYRIAMYAGALIILAYLLCNSGVEEAGRGSSILTEWIGVGDLQTCSTCNDLDGSIMEVSKRSILPARGTECMTRCRCILAYI